MKKALIGLTVFIALIYFVPGMCAQKVRPVEIALYKPLQIFRQDYSIHGIRLNLYIPYINLFLL